MTVKAVKRMMKKEKEEDNVDDEDGGGGDDDDSGISDSRQKNDVFYIILSNVFLHFNGDARLGTVLVRPECCRNTLSFISIVDLHFMPENDHYFTVLKTNRVKSPLIKRLDSIESVLFQSMVFCFFISFLFMSFFSF